MRNRQGQALVEFVLILPVFLLLVFAFIDVGRIILAKNHLESSMSEVVVLVNDNKTITDIENFLKSDNEYEINVSLNKGQYITIILNTKLDLITPGMKKIFDNPYNVEVERRVINE